VARVQGLNSNGEALSSAYVEKSEDYSIDFEGPGRTRQEFAADADINTIMKRYQKTGMGFPPPPSGPRQFVDFASMPDNLMDAMTAMSEAEAAFARLPAVVRREFDNDPASFVAFAQDRQNLEQMRSWGLAPPAEPVQAPPSPEAPQEVGTPPKGDVPF